MKLSLGVNSSPEVTGNAKTPVVMPNTTRDAASHRNVCRMTFHLPLENAEPPEPNDFADQEGLSRVGL
jgi:hypothetical protein